MAAMDKRAAQEARTFRLDPYGEQHIFRIGEKGWKLSRDGVVVTHMLSFGKPVKIALPSHAFKGIMARAMEMDDGSAFVSLELKHHDAALCVPLLAADHMDDVAADWHAWSRLMKLPMLIEEEDGGTSTVQRMLGDVRLENPQARRKRITGLKRRPLFLRKRKTGIVSNVQSVSAAEIVGRV